MLKPGGTLIYSTCSIFPEENEEQVATALKRHRDCEVKPVDTLAFDGADAPDILPGRIEGTRTICPSRLYEGFFIAKIVKN